MKIIVFGGTGFIGKPLVAALKAKGHEVQLADLRKKSNVYEDIKSSQAVINLGGHPLFKDRWNDRIKSLIYDSRIEGTEKIVNFIIKARQEGTGPEVFVNASAIGFYGASQSQTFTETDTAGSDFLAFVCRDWEEKALHAQKIAKVRTVLVRTGVVLGKNGGALEKLLLPFKIMGGTLIGSGDQWFSWVHLDDVVGLYVYAIENKNVEGPLNAVSPNPVNNSDFSHSLAKALGRPQLGLMGPKCAQQAVGLVTKIGLYVGVGGAAEVIAAGQKVLPTQALKTSYQFKFSNIDGALKSIV